MDKCPRARILCVHSNPIYLSQQPMLNCRVTSLTPIMSQWIKEVPTILVYFSIRLPEQLIYTGTGSVPTLEVHNRKVPLQFFMLGTSHFSVDNNYAQFNGKAPFVTGTVTCTTMAISLSHTAH